MSRYIRNGKVVSRRKFNATARRWPPKRRGHRASFVPMIAGSYGEGNPQESISMGCHPDQAGMLNAAMKEHGVRGVEWDRKGKCKITSRAGRARGMPIFGNMVGLSNVHDGDGGFGDG